MTDQNRSTEPNASCGCKIGRISTQYEFSGLDTALIEYWTGEADDQYSTRELATYVNRQVLEAALEAADVPVKDGEVENTYRLLTDDDVSSGTRVQTRNELQRDGVPIEQVESNFVSHQTVYNHLTDCLETSLEEPSDEERLDRGAEKLGALQNRTAAVTTSTVEQLERNDILTIGDFNVVVSVTVTCEDCLQEYTVRELLEQGSCQCHESHSDHH
ncbi:rod-determining factor RdfA [Natrinema sp. SYSU A 869]|uniref:rod-determining factor RdfA n=1 Tax=Natrinema sp. SYSU A 869 TaxID=2871694 RepID=UPI001CA41CEF|nr:rod-determining factor RdfA [Natrinema sp. SYSU A 869]